MHAGDRISMYRQLCRGPPVPYCRNRRADSDLVGRLIAKSQWRKGSLFLEEVGEMRDLFESEGVSDLGDIPVSLTEQDLGFLDNTAGNEVGRGLTDVFLQYLVEVVDVDSQAVSIVLSSPEMETLAG